ncbi:MAG: hypothetical protein HQK54_16785, partial [Oligoflexales bacterium]|nr:hypothetical protein [Oligoflexales bacterium]
NFLKAVAENRTAKELGRLLDNLAKSGSIEEVSSDAANSFKRNWFKGSQWEPPYKDNSKVLKIKLREDVKLYRVYRENENGDNNMKGAFMIDFDPGQYSSTELKDMLALGSVPNYYTEITIPKGDSMLVGVTGGNFGGHGGVVQYELLYDTNEVPARIRYEGRWSLSR